MKGAMRLRDKIAVVTGASQGLGEHLAMELAAEGARVVLAARNRGRLESILGRLRESSATGLAIPCDLREEEECRRLIDTTLGSLGAIDLLVLNAGSATFGGLGDLASFDPIRLALETNFFGAALPAHFARKALVERRGLIAYVTSGAGQLPMPGYLGYSTSKHAMNGFFETLRLELAPQGVDVLAIDPGEMYSDDGAGRTVIGPDGTEHKVDLSVRRANDVTRVPASAVASKCVEAMIRRRREVSFASASQRMATKARPFAPATIDRKIGRRIARMRSAFVAR
jgi:short-subunit dehydrogenase